MKVIVIGGGAAGMMAAIVAAKEHNQVCLLEKTNQVGNKLKITGKGRCNVTFEGDQDTFKQNIMKNGKFLYSAFSNFNNHDVMQFFEQLGVPLKVERGGRVFPVSDRAEDIVSALYQEMKRLQVEIRFESEVQKLLDTPHGVTGVLLKTGEKILGDKCIIATGGKSYSVTGSTGDGYTLAKQVGHSMVEIVPGLIPLRSQSPICKQLQGLSLRNVSLQLVDTTKEGKKSVIDTGFGEMMFAHFGLTGPLVLSASSKLTRVENVQEKMRQGNIYAYLDLKPALSFEVLDKRICRDFEKYHNREFRNSLQDLLPKKMIEVMVRLSGIEPDKKVHQITKQERQAFVKQLKHLPIPITGWMPLEMAIVTGGGIDVKEVNPKTMESKRVPNLYFAGEVLDVDAYTGGFNLQIAFSTAYLAGKNKE